jgi:hypothetical protein
LTVGRVLLAVVVAAAVGGTVSSVVLAIARWRVVTWAEPFALALVAGLMVVGAAAALLRRPGIRRVAIEIDNRLESRDLIATALELSGGPELSDEELIQIRRSAAWSTGRSVRELGPIAPDRRISLIALLVLAAALALALVPSTADVAQARQEATRQVIAEQADQLEETISQLPPEEAAQLLELLDELRDAETFEQALADITEARQLLAESQDHDTIARRTAQAGVERTLAGEGADGASAGEQLAALAEQLGEMDDFERESLADGLEQAAQDTAGIEPDLSEALQDAATSIRLGQGADELGAASEAAAAAASALQAAEGVDQAQAQLRDAQQALADAAAQQAVGEGQGQGEGQAQGEGQGQGQGQGQGEGQGGAGGGGGSGANNQGQAPSGTGSGSDVPRGGENDPDPVVGPLRGSIADVAAVDSADQVRVDMEGNEVGDIAGQVAGEGLRNLPLVPYSHQFAVYEQQALDALETLSIPPSLSDVIRDYYKELEP